MPELAAPVTARPSTLGILWRGHVFLFDKKREPATYGDAAGVRLLLIVVGLEIIRLVWNQFRPAFVPLWLERAVYLALALVAARAFAGVRLREIGFIRWAQWNAIEKSYCAQVLILLLVVFPILFADRLRAALADPSAVWTVFFPYFIYGFYQEVLYRGLLQTELVRRWGALTGILVSNTLYTFGPQHYYYFFSNTSLAVPMFASIFGMGLLFAIVFHRSGNLWIPAIMHAFGNAYAVGVFGRIR
jgi:uncharacterized protein